MGEVRVGGGVSPSEKEFRLCSCPELSSLTNVQLIATDIGVDKAFSECFLSLNKCYSPQHRLDNSIDNSIAFTCKSSRNNSVFSTQFTFRRGYFDSWGLKILFSGEVSKKLWGVN